MVITEINKTVFENLLNTDKTEVTMPNYIASD